MECKDAVLSTCTAESSGLTLVPHIVVIEDAINSLVNGCEPEFTESVEKHDWSLILDCLKAYGFGNWS